MPTIIVEFNPEDIKSAEEVLHQNADILERISERARREFGARHHGFYADTEGRKLVAIDEWGDPDDFRRFFDGNGDIRKIMDQAGVKAPPTVTVLMPMQVPGTF